MIKWFAYIVLLLIFAPCLSYAKTQNNRFDIVFANFTASLHFKEILGDTTIVKSSKKQEQEERNKIKEVAKAKKQPKPEKIESINTVTSKTKQRPKRQRRPEGLERPPEIPRRNGN